MAKVELSLQEYDDLVLATSKSLNDKLQLKKQLVEEHKKYIELLAKHLDERASIWTYKFDENVEITLDNLEDYICYSDYKKREFELNDLLEAVRVLYGRKFNK